MPTHPRLSKTPTAAEQRAAMSTLIRLGKSKLKPFVDKAIKSVGGKAAVDTVVSTAKALSSAPKRKKFKIEAKGLLPDTIKNLRKQKEEKERQLRELDL